MIELITYLEREFRRYFENASHIEVHLNADKEIIEVRIVGPMEDNGPAYLESFVCEIGSDDDYYTFTGDHDTTLTVPLMSEADEKLPDHGDFAEASANTPRSREWPGSAPDQNGVTFDYLRLWSYDLSGRPCSDGSRVTSAKALQIASDVLLTTAACRNAGIEPTKEMIHWTEDDMRLALSAIAGIRAQRGCEDYDPCITDGFLTHLMDLAIYG